MSNDHSQPGRGQANRLFPSCGSLFFFLRLFALASESALESVSAYPSLIPPMLLSSLFLLAARPDCALPHPVSAEGTGSRVLAHETARPLRFSSAVAAESVYLWPVGVVRTPSLRAASEANVASTRGYLIVVSACANEVRGKSLWTSYAPIRASEEFLCRRIFCRCRRYCHFRCMNRQAFRMR